jgi:peptide deformylase
MGQIITLGNEVLRIKSEIIVDFNEENRQYIESMFKIMEISKGVGLASVQLGNLKRIFISLVPKDKPRIFINPEIIETSIDEEAYEEGCLSIPGINADVTRSSKVVVQAFDEKGKPFTIRAEGLLARVIQHEVDHLNGLLFIDHLHPDQQERLLEQYKRKIKH